MIHFSYAIALCVAGSAGAYYAYLRGVSFGYRGGFGAGSSAGSVQAARDQYEKGFADGFNTLAGRISNAVCYAERDYDSILTGGTGDLPEDSGDDDDDDDGERAWPTRMRS